MIYKNDSSTFQTFGAIVWVVPLPSSGKWRFGSGLPSLKIECHPGGCILQRGTTQAIIIIIISKIPHIISEGSWDLTSFRSFSVLNPDILLVFWWKCSSDYSLACNLSVTVRAPPNSPWRGFARWLCVDARNCPIICEESICELVLICFPYPIRSMYNIFTYLYHKNQLEMCCRNISWS